MHHFEEGLRRLEIGSNTPAVSVATHKSSTDEKAKHNDLVTEASICVATSSLKAGLSKAQALGSGYCSPLTGTVADGWITGPVNETGVLKSFGL